MKAIVQDVYGPPEVLELRDIDRPPVRDDEVLIQVRATSVNAADWIMTMGRPYLVRLMSGLRTPRMPVRGQDVAGRVEAVGRHVTRLRPGDEVYAEVPAGGFAEYVSTPEDPVARKPANLTFEQAAAGPLAGNTALLGLRDTAGVQPGQRVLVNGASGGVGTFAVQIARALGAEVTGVCRTSKVDLVRSIGADQVIDHTRQDFTRTGQRYDVIFDLASSRSVSDHRRALTPRGTLVLAGGGGGRWFGPLGSVARALMLSPLVRQHLRALVATRNRQRLDDLTELIEAGRVTPVIDRIYPLSEARDAVGHVEQGHARGKVVVTV